MTNPICEYHLWYLLFTLYKTRLMSSEYHITIYLHIRFRYYGPGRRSYFLATFRGN